MSLVNVWMKSGFHKHGPRTTRLTFSGGTSLCLRCLDMRTARPPGQSIPGSSAAKNELNGDVRLFCPLLYWEKRTKTINTAIFRRFVLKWSKLAYFRLQLTFWTLKTRQMILNERSMNAIQLTLLLKLSSCSWRTSLNVPLEWWFNHSTLSSTFFLIWIDLQNLVKRPSTAYSTFSRAMIQQFASKLGDSCPILWGSLAVLRRLSPIWNYAKIMSWINWQQWF